ncbi:hypothetical protein ACX0G9_13115 [Flavitalea flava]
MQDEITKHTRKAYGAIKDSSKKWTEKVTEILIEICIIVFAVSLSIWFHKRSEHAKEQADVKEFLLGLKTDLNGTIASGKDAIEGYKDSKERFTWLSSLSRNRKPNTDSLNKYFDLIYSSPVFISYSSRYEGFKSSGKLEQIENKKLLDAILDFYQQDIPTCKGTVGAWDAMRNQLHNLVIDNLVRNEDGTDNRFQVVTMPKAHNLCESLIPWGQLFERHEILIKDAQGIVRQIDETYPEK